MKLVIQRPLKYDAIPIDNRGPEDLACYDLKFHKPRGRGKTKGKIKAYGPSFDVISASGKMLCAAQMVIEEDGNIDFELKRMDEPEVIPAADKSAEKVTDTVRAAKTAVVPTGKP